MHMKDDTNISALVKEISRKSGISTDQAMLAVAALLGFLGAKMPSPVMGQIRQALLDEQNDAMPAEFVTKYKHH